jgi:hypothetical protein
MIATYATGRCISDRIGGGLFSDDFSSCRAIPAAAQNSPPSAGPCLADLSNFAQTKTVCERSPWEQVSIPKWQWESDGNLMSTFGFYPGPIDYWMLVTDWRGGSIAIMLVIGALIVGYAFRTGSPAVLLPPTAVLPTHASPAIAEGEVDEGDAGRSTRAPAVPKAPLRCPAL